MFAIYFGILIIVMLFVLLKDRIDNFKLGLILIIAYLFILSAIKSPFLNGDLINYTNYFNNTSALSFKELVRECIGGERLNIGFLMFAKICSMVGLSAELWIVLIAFIFAISAGYFMNRYSSSPFISLIMCVALYFSFTFSGLKQTMAMAIIMFAYIAIFEKRPIKFLLLILVASLFNASAFYFIFAYPLSIIKLKRTQLPIIIFALVIAIVSPNVLRGIILNFSINDHLSLYADYSTSNNWTSYIIQLFVWATTAIFYDKDDSQVTMCLNCMMIGICIQGFAGSIAEIFRMSYYYSMCCIVALPNAMNETVLKSNRDVLKTLVIILFLILISRNTVYSNMRYFW